MRVLVWAAALAAGFFASSASLRAVGILEVDHVIDLYAGTGVGRFAVLLVLIPLWAALASTLAHVALEWVARRRAREQQVSPSPSDAPRR
ncbi:MAG: hypothetical protein ACRDY7_14020 [Acidimicrobiia bacterium]